MLAIFDFSSLLTVLLLSICTTTYLRELRPTIFETVEATTTADGTTPSSTKKKRDGMTGFLWKLSRIGERLSPYVGAACAIQAMNILFGK